MLAEQSLRNVRVMVQQNFQIYLLFLLKTEKEKNHDSSTLGATYIQKLVNLLQILFSYGVCLPNNSNNSNNSQKDLLLECFGSRRKLNNIFLDSIIENLALSF